MYILKNAVKNFGRNKGRNFMVLMIALLTLTSVSLSFSIKTISNLAITRYQDSFHVDATFDYDWEKAEKDFPPREIQNSDGSITQISIIDVPQISIEEYLKYADSQYVKGADFYVACTFACDTLTPVPDNTYEGQEWIRMEGLSLEEILAHYNVSTKQELFDTGMIATEQELQ